MDVSLQFRHVEGSGTMLFINSVPCTQRTFGGFITILSATVQADKKTGKAMLRINAKNSLGKGFSLWEPFDLETTCAEFALPRKSYPKILFTITDNEPLLPGTDPIQRTGTISPVLEEGVSRDAEEPDPVTVGKRMDE